MATAKRTSRSSGRPMGRGTSRCRRPATRTSASYQLGLTGDIPVPNVTVANAIAISRRTVANLMRTADLDGDGRADLTVYRPSTGTWFNLQSKTNYTAFTTFQWGVERRHPGVERLRWRRQTDLAVWRPSNGTWFIRAVEHELRHVRVVPVGSRRRRSRPRRLRRRRHGGSRGLAAGQRDVVHPAVERRTTRPTCRSSGASPATSRCLATTTATARPISPCGGRPPATWFIRQSSTDYATDVSIPVGARRATSPSLAITTATAGPTSPCGGRPTGTWFILQSSAGYATYGVDPVGPGRGRPGPGRLRRRRQDRSGGLAGEQRHVVPAGVGHQLHHDRGYQWGLSGDIPILPRR